jgi:hypothetical protein
MSCSQGQASSSTPLSDNMSDLTIDRKARHQFLYPFVRIIQLFVNLSVVHTDIVTLKCHTYINIAASVTISVTNQCYISDITMLTC